MATRLKPVAANNFEEEVKLLEEELLEKRRRYWDSYGKPPPGVAPTPALKLEDFTNPFALKVPWEHYSKIRLICTSLLYSTIAEAATIHYSQYSHQNKIPYTGTVAGVMKNTLHHEGLNTFRTHFPPLAVQSAVAKTIFFPVFEYLRLKIAIPYMEYNSNEEESLRTGVSAVAASFSVFWISRAGELNNILNSKFHTFAQRINPLPFGMFSAVPNHGSPYYNTRNNAVVFTTRFLLPNMLWWPTYVYTKNIIIKDGLDPVYGGPVMIGASALAASAVATIGCQPIFILRDAIGSHNIPKLLSGDREVYRLLRNYPKPYRFYVTKQLLGRFLVGAPVGVFGAFFYEMLKMASVSSRHWFEYSYL